MKPEIILEIDEKGENIVFEVKGEMGRKCLETTRFLEEALGELTSRRLKAEYHRGKARNRTIARNLSGENTPTGS